MKMAAGLDVSARSDGDPSVRSSLKKTVTIDLHIVPQHDSPAIICPGYVHTVTKIDMISDAHIRM